MVFRILHRTAGFMSINFSIGKNARTCVLVLVLVGILNSSSAPRSDPTLTHENVLNNY